MTMKITCTAQQPDKTTFLFEDRGVSRTIEFTDAEFKVLTDSTNIDQMTELPGTVRVGILAPAIAFGIYALTMLKPGNQALVGSSIEIGKAE